MKHILFSKTVWFNVITGVVAGVMAIQGNLPQYAGVFAAILTIGNFVLRVWFTNTAIQIPQNTPPSAPAA